MAIETNGRADVRILGRQVGVTIEGERVEASADFWRAVLFDMRAREPLAAIVRRDLAKPIEAGACWWNGDGR